MRYINPIRLKVLMILFYATGTMGLIIGLVFAPPTMTIMMTFMALVNVGLGVFFTYLFLTQVQKAPDKRKKKKKSG